MENVTGGIMSTVYDRLIHFKLYLILFQLGRYLNRSYWEKRKENAAPPAYTAPSREEEEPQPVTTTANNGGNTGQVCSRLQLFVSHVLLGAQHYTHVKTLNLKQLFETFNK